MIPFCKQGMGIIQRFTHGRQLSHLSSSQKHYGKATLEGKVDRHNGIIVNTSHVPAGLSDDGFSDALKGVVYREDTKQVLLVQDAHRTYNLWKFPGGAANLGEDIGDTAVREIREETGIETEFRSILAFRQQHNHPGAFGRSDVFFLCRMTPLTFDIHPCTNEIQASCWMGLDELESSTETAPFLTHLTRLFRRGLENGFETVDIVGTDMVSIFKGMKYQLYHRPFTDDRGFRTNSTHANKYDLPS